MLELLFLSPLLLVVIGAVVGRYVIRRRPFGVPTWSMIAVFAIGAFLLPLAMGVWLPDFAGATRTLATTKSADGYSFQVTQAWNYGDFYTTTLNITAPDGTTTTPLLDGDDAKNWSVPITLNETKRMATVTLNGGRNKVVFW